ncbi:hypothetical protein EJB05_06429 [Eragrostis curvula]|uniref:NAC domain-containing protein n=1 Tax=Eragrostis curvula TaxID=38414 RepID=A0A5J9WG75_9POAL|nr:hypothetical protein EJB05_06429 [Eragrostis curvula]
MDDNQQLQQGSGVADGLELPPGFRFHPSDEEIITFYLTQKVLDDNFTAIAIGETDINKSEPWELPYKAKMGETEWYFYHLKRRKYPTGLRAIRATEAGYWKATGKDREIHHDASSVPVLLGMKKTLVFYKGRAPDGVKTDWVMHEYRLDDKGRVPCPAAGSNSHTKKPCSSSKEEWVVCRVFQKSSCARKESEFTPVSAPPSRMTIDGGGEDLSCMRFPMPTQFPLGIEDFIDNSNRLHHGLHPLLDDAFACFYSTDGMGSSVLHPLLPMVGMGSMGLQMNNDHVGNPMAISDPVPFYQQGETEITSDCSIMAEMDTRSSSMLLQDVVGVCLGQTDGAHISSVVNPWHVASSTMDMNNI